MLGYFLARDPNKMANGYSNTVLDWRTFNKYLHWEEISISTFANILLSFKLIPKGSLLDLMLRRHWNALLCVVIPVVCCNCVLTLWPEICWFSQVRLWPSRRTQIYLLEIDRPNIVFQPPLNPPLTSCFILTWSDMAMTCINQSQHRTQRLIFKSLINTHCIGIVDGCKTT